MASVDLEYNQGFKIYKGNTWFNNLVLHKATYETVVMSLGDKISGIVYYKNNKLVVDMTEYIMYKDVKYVLVNPPTVIKEGLVSDNGELKGMTKYSFTFYHPMYMLSNFPFSDVAVDDSQKQYLSQNKTFSWIGNLVDYKDKLNKNLEGTQWKVSIGTNVTDAEKNKLSEVLSFDNNTIADALKTAYETWEIPYIVDKVEAGTQDYLINKKRFVVQFGLPSDKIYKKDKNGNFVLDDNNQKIPFVFKYGQGVGLKNNSRTPKNNKIVTRIAGYGSEDNIPYGYPQIVWTGNQDWNYTINNDSTAANSYPIYDGIVGGQKVRLIKHPFTRTHLMPSIYSETVNKKVNPNATGYNPNTELVDYYDANDNTYPNQIKAGEQSYEIHEFEDIKPEFGSFSINSATPYDGHSDESITQNKFLSIVDDLYTETDIKAEKTQLNALRTSFVTQQQNSAKGTSGNYEYDWSFKTDGQYKKVKYASSGANFEYVVNVGLTPATIDWDDTMDEQGNYVQSYFKVTIPALGFDLYASAAITQEMTINMRSGACIGCSFPVMVDWDDYKRNFYDKDGNFAPTGTQRNYTKYPNSTNASITLILQKETNTFGTLMPNIYQKPASGDKFVILGISLPTSYITTAEGKLETEMKKYMRDNNVYYYEYPLKFDEHFLISNEHILSQMKPNVIVNFEYADVVQSLYIKQMSIKYNESPLPKYDITLTDDVDVVLNKIGVAIAEYRGQRQYENRGGNSETLDGNKFLRKDINDTASGTIRMLKGLQVGERFVTGLLGEGGIFRKDDDGTTYLECDRMYVRMKAYFDTVEVRRFIHSGGNRVASAAGIKCSRVEYYTQNNLTTTDASEAAYFRCYFRANDNGTEITNDFEINDLAYCKETNKVGEQANTTNAVATRSVSSNRSVSEENITISLVITNNTNASVTLDGEARLVLSNPDVDGTYHGWNGSYNRTDRIVFSNSAVTLAVGESRTVTLSSELYRRSPAGDNALAEAGSRSNVILYVGGVSEVVLCSKLSSSIVFQNGGTYNVSLTQGGQGISQRFYWRKVIGVSSAVTLDGEHYIDLSATDCATGSDVPIAQDDIIQLGNTIDAKRQGAIIEFVSGEDAPSYQIYQGINTYNLDNKNYIGLGYSSQTGRAYMNVYGDFLFGDKAESTYIKYVQEDEETGEPRLKIKAEVEFIHSDGQGGTESTTMDDFIDAIKHSIEDIQDQIDGSIDTWYYEGVPTLLNLPASEWNTDELKREHIGDLYYDKESGNAYRFIYDTTVEPNEYKWIQLHDDAISEALRLAAEAKDTADNKRRVFLTQPTPPYDQGDLWVNAVWPTSGEHQGETYNNEILKCVTAKTDQQTFSISDWSVANGYTAALNNFLTNTYAPFISNIQGQVDQKAETWYQDSNPATAWYDATQTPVYDVRAKHVGDIWMDTSANGGKQTYIYQYNTSTANYEWKPQAVPNEVFDYADGKCAIYVNNPTNAQNPYPTNYHEKDMWILPIDGMHDTYTIGGVEFKAGEVLFSSADSTSFVAAHWSKKLRYTGDERIDGFINQILNGTGASGDDATVANAISSIKGALNEGTLIDGGLVLTSVLGLRSNSRVWAGISGMYNTAETGTGYKGHGIAAWYGGGMADWEVYLDTLTQEQRQSATITDAYAKSLFRFDGSGYLAGGNITWDAQGRVAIKDITTLVGGNNTDVLNALATFNSAFRFTTSPTQSSTILNINPQYAFSHLEISDVKGNHAVATTDYVNENFVTKAFFNRLFQAYSSSTIVDANKVSPNDTTSAIDNLKILVGTWTEQYLSALGNNPNASGGGGISDLSAVLNELNSKNDLGTGVLVRNGLNNWSWMPYNAGTSGIDENAMWVALGGTSSNQKIDNSHLSLKSLTFKAGASDTTGVVYSPTDNADKEITFDAAANSGISVTKDNNGTFTIGYTMPSTMPSTSLVTNLNADLLDSHDSTYFVNTGSTWSKNERHDGFIVDFRSSVASTSDNPFSILRGNAATVIQNLPDNSTYGAQLAFGFGSARLLWRARNNSSTMSDWVGIIAGSADKLTTARTISLTGDVSGSTTFDGSEDKSISVTITKTVTNDMLDNSSITINGSSVSLGGTFSTENVTAGTAGISTATEGGTLAVPYVTVNQYGIVTGYGTHTHSVTRLSGNDTKSAWGQEYWKEGVPQNVSGRLSLGSSDIYWKENNYGDQFSIEPSFSGTDDSNILQFKSAVGASGTTPSMTTKMVIAGKSGYVGIGTTSPQYTLDVTGNIRATAVSWFPSIELYANAPYIDFHKDATTASDIPDYTTRIIENASGVLSVMAKTGTTGFVVGSQNADYIQIGDIRIVYDNAATNGNNALKIVKADGSDANFYATGAVSSLGAADSSGQSTFDEAAMWDALSTNTGLYANTKIHSGHLNLTGYAKTTDLAGYVKGVKFNNGTAKTPDSNGIVDLGDISVTGDYLPLIGGTLTGSVNSRYAGIDVTLRGNGVSSKQYQTTLSLNDKDNRIFVRTEGIVEPYNDNNVESEKGGISWYSYIRQYNTSGTQVAQRGIRYRLSKPDGNNNVTGTWTIDDAASFRSAIGVDDLNFATIKNINDEAGGSFSDVLASQTGSFLFYGNNLYEGKWDWVGLQVGSSVDKGQMMFMDGTLIVRQNDSTSWTEWATVITDKNYSSKITSISGYTKTQDFKTLTIKADTTSVLSYKPSDSDNSTLTFKAGTNISLDTTTANQIEIKNTYSLPTASSSKLGGVKVNGNGLKIESEVLKLNLTSSEIPDLSDTYVTLTTDQTISGQKTFKNLWIGDKRPWKFYSVNETDGQDSTESLNFMSTTGSKNFYLVDVLGNKFLKFASGDSNGNRSGYICFPNGIGTESPYYSLTIAGNISFDTNGTRDIGSATNLANAIFAKGGYFFGDTPAVHVGTDYNNFIALHWSSDGNRGLYGGGWIIGNNGTNTYLNKGNVGIGTESPSQKLEVNGNVKATRFYLTDHLYFEVDGTSIKCHGDFYATGAVSALGAASGGSGFSLGNLLNDLNSTQAVQGTPSNGQTLVYNGGWTFGKAGSDYTLPTASASTKGGITVNGNGLVMDGTTLKVSLSASNIPNISETYVTKADAQTITGSKTFSAQQSFTYNGAPFTVSSTTKVTNLNADKLDGYDSTYFVNEGTTWSKSTRHDGFIVNFTSTTSSTADNPFSIIGDNAATVIQNLPDNSTYGAQLAFGFGSARLVWRNRRNSAQMSDWVGVIAGSADKLTTKKKLWGQDFDGTAAVDGQLTVHYATDSAAWASDYGGIIIQNTTGANPYTLGLAVNDGFAEIQSSQITVGAKPLILNKKGGNVGIGTDTPSTPLDVNGVINSRSNITAQGYLSVGSYVSASTYVSAASYVKIGNLYIVYDQNNNALKVSASATADTAANFYATGAVSALGSNTSGGGGVGDVTWDALATTATGGRTIHYSYINDAVLSYGYISQLSADNRYVMLNGSASITGDLIPESTALNLLLGSSSCHWTEGHIDNIYMNSTSNNSKIEIAGAASTLTIKATSINNPAATLSIQNSNDARSLSLCSGGGNVGIGTSPNSSYKLYVNGNTYLNGVLNVKDFFIQNSGPNYYNIGANGVTVYQNGTWTGGSDIRRKDIVTNIGCDINQIASAPIFDFIWKADITRTVHVGTSAQYWSKVFENAVSEGVDGYLYMDYGATALASSVITARKVLDHEGRIRLLEIENQALRKEIEQLKKAA